VVALRFDAGTVTVAAGRPVVLGREPSSSDQAEGRTVPGEATTVSKSHLLVHFDGTRVTVEDLGSTNGSTVARDGRVEVLAPGAPVAVEEGERVAMGSVTFVVDRGGAT
jgi:pSer/pThr/pTyr-binding forkhead associated (FHA) protein